jgi:hypothetical protein
MILLTEYFVSDNPDRQREYITCLTKNIENKYIEKIVLFNSDDSKLNISSDKIVMVNLTERPTYKSIFDHCNKNYSGQICILSNADIIFDDTLTNINEENIKGKFLALSRWDITENGQSRLYDWSFSQDSWIYLSPFEFKDSNYTMGLPGCDNRIVFDASSSGLKPHNPCKIIRTHHLHNSNHRTYKQQDILLGNYMFVESSDSMDNISENLLCNPSTLNQAVAYVRNKKIKEMNGTN